MGRPSPIPIAPGLRFHRLTVIERAGVNSNGGFRWRCRCDCGNISYPDAASLRRGASKSCSCLQKEIVSNNVKKLIGQCFGYLTVIERAGSSPSGPQWLCRCVCGMEKITAGKNLRDGKTKSCGCQGKPPITPGMRFGRLTVINLASSSGETRYTCCCDCKNITQPTASNLRRGDTLSCGCLRLDRITSHGQGPVVGSRSDLDSIL